MGRVVAIDGPSGAGKSTVAKMLAERLGFRYLDTGALYRAVALGLLKAGATPDDDDGKIRKALVGIKVEFREGKAYLNGEDVSREIRTTEAGHYSSVFSARRPVREYLLPVQREAGRNDDLVAEGRDMATVVFPNAWRKFYIDASLEARATRRFLQLKDNGVEAAMEAATDDVSKRDERDSKRDLAPLRRADDATYIDSSSMGVEDVMRTVMEAVEARR